MARSIGRKQLVDRWKTQDGTEKRNAVLRALAHNGDLSRLGLEMHEGRYDLRGLSVPEARLQESARIGAFDVRILKGLTEFHDIQLQSLDLSYSALKHIR